MRGKISIIDAETGKVLEDLGSVVYNNANAVFEMYEEELDSWLLKGYLADVWLEEETV